jgi:hypothetical protein
MNAEVGQLLQLIGTSGKFWQQNRRMELYPRCGSMLSSGHVCDARREVTFGGSLYRRGRREHMTAWGPGNFEKDESLDFIQEEIDRHVAAIEAIFVDSQRFQLDDTGNAEGELMPRVAFLALLLERSGGVFDSHNETDVGAWKAQYLEMYDDQVDDLEPGGDYKLQRRAVIADTFDTLIRLQQK